MERRVKINPLLLFAMGFVIGGVGLSIKIPFVVLLFVGLVGLMVFFENPMISLIACTFGYVFLPDILVLMLLYGTFGLYLFRKFVKKDDPLIVAGHEVVPYMYFVLMIVQTVTSMYLMGSLRDLAIHTGGFMYLIFLVNEIKTEEQLHHIVVAVAVAATLLALVGIYQYVVGVDIKKEWVDTSSNGAIRARAYSVFGNPNIFAEYLVMAIPLTVGIFWSTKRDGVRLLFFGMFAVQVLSLVMTMSRGGWLGLAVAAFVFVCLVRKELLLLAIPVLGAGVFLVPESIVSRFMTIFNLADSSTSYRFKIWEITETMIHDHFFIGLGLGHLPFKMVFEQYIRTMPIYHAHNTFLEVFAEMGIIGFLLFVVFVASIFVNLARYPLKSDDAYIKIMGAAVSASFAGMLFHGLFENIFYMTKITTTFWLLLAVTFALVRICKKRLAALQTEKRMESYGKESFI
ncbi:MAG: O-antigen ligase family protein [Peptoniphilus sp.]|nr:O-antigen ligase family protein [Peptoniphilus sp.]MDY3118453.1 O-antigen ligase family protein [Peptoniphilus sp.]